MQAQPDRSSRQIVEPEARRNHRQHRGDALVSDANPAQLRQQIHVVRADAAELKAPVEEGAAASIDRTVQTDSFLLDGAGPRQITGPASRSVLRRCWSWLSARHEGEGPSRWRLFVFDGRLRRLHD